MKKIVIFCCLTMFAWLVPFLNSWPKPITNIANKTNGTNGLKSNIVARIYKGQIEKWPDGQKIFVIDRPFDSEIRHQFYNIALASKPTKKFFKPGSPIPFKKMILNSDFATSKFVARIPNAIGYIFLSEVDDTVKVLKIDGKLPSDDGYKLRYKIR